MSKQQAKNVKVLVNSQPLAGLTDCSLNLTTAFATSEAKEDIAPIDEPLRVDWEISVSGEFGREDESKANATVVQSYLKQGAKPPITFVIGDMAKYSGKSLVTSYSETAGVEGKTTYSATFKGISKLTKGALPVNEE